MNQAYYILENKIKQQEPVEEQVIIAGAIGVVLFRLLFIVAVIWEYSTQAMKGNKVEPRLTKRFNEVLSKKMHGKSWTVRVVEEKGVINAWTFGGSNLYITRGLMNILNEDEIMAVMLHEAGHSKEYHVAQRVAIREGGFALFLFLLVKACGGFDKGNDKNAEAIAYIAFFAWQIISPLVGIAEAYWSRVNEFWADSWATKYGYGKHMISAFKKMIKASGGERKKCKSKLCEWARKIEHLYASHPDMQKRIERILESEEGKKALRASGGDTTKALLSLAKAAGTKKEDVNEFYKEQDKSSFMQKAKNFFRRDVIAVFK